MARVLITREFAEPLAAVFRGRGHEVVHVPLVSLKATGELPPSDAPSAVLVTSQAVARFVPNLSDHIGSAPVFSVGPATAESLRSIGINPEHVGSTDGLAALDAIDELAKSSAWFVGAAKPSESLAKALYAAGVRCWSVYQNHRPSGYAEQLLEARVDAVAFTSASAIRAYVDVLGVPEVMVIALGERTASAAVECGFDDVRMSPSLDLNGMGQVMSSGD